jgi:hypothetical protein
MNTPFGIRRLMADGRDLFLQISPRWAACAGATWISREPGDFTISERFALGRHYQSRRSIRVADTIQDNLNEIGRLGHG